MLSGQQPYLHKILIIKALFFNRLCSIIKPFNKAKELRVQIDFSQLYREKL